MNVLVMLHIVTKNETRKAANFTTQVKNSSESLQYFMNMNSLLQPNDIYTLSYI